MIRNRDNDFVNDFEAMLAKKREDGTKRRKSRDIDIINDNDDIIDQLIQDMRAAAEVRYLKEIIALSLNIIEISMNFSKNKQTG